MPQRRPRHRDGAVPEVELDGSVTLYGIEDWTQVRDDPVLRIEPRPSARDGEPVQVAEEGRNPDPEDH